MTPKPQTQRNGKRQVEVQVTPDTVTTGRLAFVTEEPTVWSVWSLATHTRTLTVSQDTTKTRSRPPGTWKGITTPNSKEKGEDHPDHSFPWAVMRRTWRGVTEPTPEEKEPIIQTIHFQPHHQVNNQSMKCTWPPLAETPGERRKSLHAGVHPTCLTIQRDNHKGPCPKEWMALWPVDHAAPVDTSKSPRTAPTGRLGSVT